MEFDPKVDYYSILGIRKEATGKEIKNAYHALAKKYHPDVNKSANPTKFKQISEAHSILSNRRTRSQYDSMRNADYFSNETTQSAHTSQSQSFKTNEWGHTAYAWDKSNKRKKWEGHHNPFNEQSFDFYQNLRNTNRRKEYAKYEGEEYKDYSNYYDPLRNVFTSYHNIMSDSKVP